MEPLSPDSAATFNVMRALRRHWRLIALLTIACAAIGGVYVLVAPKSYTSSATVQIKPILGNAFSPDTSANATVAMQTESQLVGLNGPRVRTALLQAAALRAGGELTDNPPENPRVTKTIDTLTATCDPTAVSAAVLTNAFLIKVSYTSHSAATSAVCAQDFAQTYLDYRSALTVVAQQTQTERLDTAALNVAKKLVDARQLPQSNPANQALVSQYTLQLNALQTQSAQITSLPTTPGSFIVYATAGQTSNARAVLVVAGAGVLGLILGVLIALTLGRRDRRILTETNERNLGMPVLATVVMGKNVPTGTPLPDAASDESFRMAAISVIAGTDSHSVVGVSPLSPQESAAGVSIRLARGIAAAGYRVVLVDAVTDGPQVGALLDMEPRTGLSDIIDGAGFDTVNVIDFDGLEVLEAGTDPSSGRQRYAGARTREFLGELKRATDYVVIATSAISSADGLGVLLASDHALIVADDHSTTYEDIAEVKTLARRLDVNVLGLVVARTANVTSRHATAPQKRGRGKLEAADGGSGRQPRAIEGDGGSPTSSRRRNEPSSEPPGSDRGAPTGGRSTTRIKL